jgi:hypothetical protein
VPVHRALGETRGLGDLIERRALIADLQEYSTRFLKQALPGVLLIRIYRTGGNQG